MKKYFLHDGNIQTGGFTLAEISKMELSPATHVWFDGQSDWEPVERFEELRPFINYPKKANGITDSEKIKAESGKDKTGNTKRVSNKTGAIIFNIIALLGLFGLYVLWEKSYPYIKDFIYPTITFHTGELQKMAENGTDYTINGCRKNEFNYASKSVNVGSGVKKTALLFSKKGEVISIISDAQNRFEYAFEFKGAYNKLLKEIKEKQTAVLPPNARDKYYAGFEKYVINDCIFVDLGFLENVKYSVIAVIQKDKLLSSTSSPGNDSSKTINQNISSKSPVKILGIWSGESEGKDISFVVEKVDTSKVKGYCYIDGNFTEFDGSITSNDSGYRLTLDGSQIDNKSGTFDLFYDGAKQIITGSWEAYDQSLSLKLDLTSVTKGKTARVIMSNAYIYKAPDYSGKTDGFLVTGDTLEFDYLNKGFIHCDYKSGGEPKSGWFEIKDVTFQ